MIDRIRDITHYMEDMTDIQLMDFVQTIRRERGQRRAKIVQPKKVSRKAKASAFEIAVKTLSPEEISKLISELER